MKLTAVLNFKIRRRWTVVHRKVNQPYSHVLSGQPSCFNLIYLWAWPLSWSRDTYFQLAKWILMYRMRWFSPQPHLDIWDISREKAQTQADRTRWLISLDSVTAFQEKMKILIISVLSWVSYKQTLKWGFLWIWLILSSQKKNTKLMCK